MIDYIDTAIYECCREWVGPALAGIYKPGRCGICNEVPVYKRPDPESPLRIAPPIRPS